MRQDSNQNAYQKARANLRSAQDTEFFVAAKNQLQRVKSISNANRVRNAATKYREKLIAAFIDVLDLALTPLRSRKGMSMQPSFSANLKRSESLEREE
jgi:hypothetical protein